MQALELARTVKPDAVTLDLRLPDIDGWVLLDRLKHDPTTRHIPVHVISGLDEERRGLHNGALGFLHKPVTQEDLKAGLAASASSSRSASSSCSSSRTIRSRARRSPT